MLLCVCKPLISPAVSSVGFHSSQLLLLLYLYSEYLCSPPLFLFSLAFFICLALPWRPRRTWPPRGPCWNPFRAQSTRWPVSLELQMHCTCVCVPATVGVLHILDLTEILSSSVSLKIDGIHLLQIGLGRCTNANLISFSRAHGHFLFFFNFIIFGNWLNLLHACVTTSRLTDLVNSMYFCPVAVVTWQNKKARLENWTLTKLVGKLPPRWDLGTFFNPRPSQIGSRPSTIWSNGSTCGRGETPWSSARSSASAPFCSCSTLYTKPTGQVQSFKARRTLLLIFVTWRAKGRLSSVIGGNPEVLRSRTTFGRSTSWCGNKIFSDMNFWTCFHVGKMDKVLLAGCCSVHQDEEDPEWKSVFK